MKDKYGDGGYAKHYVIDEDYLGFLETIRALLCDKEAFKVKYRAVTGG